MNLNIQELFRRAGGRIEIENDAESTLWTYTDEGFDPEKFAELIVRQCMDTLYSHGYDDALEHLGKHFGVQQ
jgi:hypothetical protein